MLDNITLILQNAPVLDFVNGVRKRLHLTPLTELPQSGLRFGADDCPISSALVGDQTNKLGNEQFQTGPYTWTVPASNTKLLGALVGQIGAAGDTAKVNYNSLADVFYVTQPQFIQHWIETHDIEMGRLRKIEEDKALTSQTVDLSKVTFKTYGIPEPGNNGAPTETEADKELVSF